MTSLTPLEFLSLLWPSKLLTNETLELRVRRRADGEIKRHFASSISEFIDKAMSYSDEWDCYQGVATRFGRSGKKVDCYRVGTVWADLDKKKIEDCRFSIKPDILVNSGGGVHAYWLLESQFLLRGERWLPIEAVNRAISHKFNSDICTIDVSRILRTPGTLNHKFDPGKLVKAYAL